MLLEVDGKTILGALENGLSHVEDSAGRFPHVSGLTVKADVSKVDEVQMLVDETVKAFGQELAARLSLPIEYWDERLSTVEAQRRLASAGRRGPKAKARRDAAAAAIVLQSYLDSKAQGSPLPPFES